MTRVVRVARALGASEHTEQTSERSNWSFDAQSFGGTDYARRSLAASASRTVAVLQRHVALWPQCGSRCAVRMLERAHLEDTVGGPRVSGGAAWRRVSGSVGARRGVGLFVRHVRAGPRLPSSSTYLPGHRTPAALARGHTRRSARPPPIAPPQASHLARRQRASGAAGGVRCGRRHGGAAAGAAGTLARPRWVGHGESARGSPRLYTLCHSALSVAYRDGTRVAAGPKSSREDDSNWLMSTDECEVQHSL